MASETVDPIDPPPSWAVLPARHVHSINQCNLSGTRTFNRSMRGNHHQMLFISGQTDTDNCSSVVYIWSDGHRQLLVCCLYLIWRTHATARLLFIYYLTDTCNCSSVVYILSDGHRQLLVCCLYLIWRTHATANCSSVVYIWSDGYR